MLSIQTGEQRGSISESIESLMAMNSSASDPSLQFIYPQDETGEDRIRLPSFSTPSSKSLATVVTLGQALVAGDSSEKNHIHNVLQSITHNATEKYLMRKKKHTQRKADKKKKKKKRDETGFDRAQEDPRRKKKKKRVSDNGTEETGPGTDLGLSHAEKKKWKKKMESVQPLLTMVMNDLSKGFFEQNKQHVPRYTINLHNPAHTGEPSDLPMNTNLRTPFPTMNANSAGPNSQPFMPGSTSSNFASAPRAERPFIQLPFVNFGNQPVQPQHNSQSSFQQPSLYQYHSSQPVLPPLQPQQQQPFLLPIPESNGSLRYTARRESHAFALPSPLQDPPSDNEHISPNSSPSYPLPHAHSLSPSPGAPFARPILPPLAPMTTEQWVHSNSLDRFTFDADN